jgi:glycosyltransferase involved in cell wall biosynthesis
VGKRSAGGTVLKLRVALVHDYLNEFGGAERVLWALHEMFSEAPIYTAFKVGGSAAERKFRGAKVVTSWAQKIPFFRKLYSPLRFLAPWIWGSIAKKLKKYDLVITSASGYITKGLHKNEICYCHTPPRFLYGYQTAREWQKYWPIRMYGLVLNHFLRQYDFKQAQKVKRFVVNSEETRRRIKKFYRREAEVVYPPAATPTASFASWGGRASPLSDEREDYWLIVSRLVRMKNIELGIKACLKLKQRLVIVGEGRMREKLGNLGDQMKGLVEFKGRVDDEELVDLYARAKGFLALAEDEDFGMTPVEAMSQGTPIVAYWGGGYKESVTSSTGVFFKKLEVSSLIKAMRELAETRWNRETIIEQAKKFSKEEFEKEIKNQIVKIKDDF